MASAYVLHDESFLLGDLWVSMDFLVYFLSFEVLLLYVSVKRGKRALG